MKQKHITIPTASLFAALVCLLLSACSKEQEMADSQPLVVMAEILSPLTRVDSPNETPDEHASDYDKTAFQNGDEIMVYKSSASSTTAIKYSKSGSYWLLSEGQTALTTTGSETFTAYFPESFTTILEDQSSKPKFWQSNKLVSTASAMGNLVKFKFAPAFAKVTINVEYTTAFSGTPAASVDGNGILSGSTSQQINLLFVGNEGNKYNYTGIINSGINIALKITVPGQDGGTKSYTDNSRLFEAGKNYIYNFTSSNGLILNGVSVKDFTEISEGDGVNGDWSAT